MCARPVSDAWLGSDAHGAGAGIAMAGAWMSPTVIADLERDRPGPDQGGRWHSDL